MAAELWGVPLEQVMGEIRAGAVVSKLDYGFMLVDVAPDSCELAPPPIRKPVPAPMTFVPAGAIEEAEAVAAELVSDLVAAPAAASDSVDAVPQSTADLVASVDVVPPVDVVSPVEFVAPAEGAVPVEGVVPLDYAVPVECVIPVERVMAMGSAKPKGRARFTPSLPPPESSHADDESEDGPDPNFGEPDDGKPLDWRAARARAATQRRRPPTRFN